MALKHLVQIAIVVVLMVSDIHGQFRIEDGRLVLYIYRSTGDTYQNATDWCLILGGVIPSLHSQADLSNTSNRVFEDARGEAKVWLSGNVDSSNRITWSDGSSDYGRVNSEECTDYNYRHRQSDCCKTILVVDRTGQGSLHAKPCSQSDVHPLCVIKQTKRESQDLIKSFAEESIMSIILSANQTEKRLEDWKLTTVSRINKTFDKLTQYVDETKTSIDSHMQSVEEQTKKNLTTFKNNARLVMDESAKNITAKLLNDFDGHLTSSSVAMDRFKSELQRSQELFAQEIRFQLEGKINEISMKMLHHKEIDDGKHDKTNNVVYFILFILCMILLGLVYKFVKGVWIMRKNLEKLIKQDGRVELNDFQDKAA